MSPTDDSPPADSPPDTSPDAAPAEALDEAPPLEAGEAPPIIPAGSPPEAAGKALSAGDHLFLVDGSNFIFRAYYQSMNQDRKYQYRSDGTPTGAVRLFAGKLLQFVREGAAGILPSHLAILFDKSENSFRREMYPAYKGNRSEPPEELTAQMPLMRDAVRAFGLVPVEQDVYEADDLIATYCRIATERGADVTIVSADKDLMQLVGPGVSMFDPASGSTARRSGDEVKNTFRAERRIGREEVIAYFGVPPERVVDVQALAGDSTDNVPGAPGIGLKTAAQLIAEYGDLETLLMAAPDIRQPKRRATLTDPAIVDQVRMSKRLVTLVRDVPLKCPVDDLRLPPIDPVPLVAFLKAMEFTTLTRRVAELTEIDPAEVEPDARLAAPSRARRADAAVDAEGMPLARPAADATGGADEADGLLTPQSKAARVADAVLEPPIDPKSYETITDLERLRDWIEDAREQGHLAFDTETDSLDALNANLVGVSLAVRPGRAAYVPLAHRAPARTDLFGSGGEEAAPSGDLLPGQIPLEEALALLKPLLEEPGVLKIAQNLKFDALVMSRYGVALAPADDTMLMSYVLDAGLGPHGMDDLSKRHLKHAPITYAEVAGTGRGKVTFDRVAIDRATAYAAEDADVTLRLWHLLKARLLAERKVTVYETLERPLIPVLARMERRGILIDREILSRLSGDFAQKAAALEAEIQDTVGEPFNIGSPKQLGDVLFGKMGLPGGRKTATGQWSTTVNVLDELAEQGHELPKRMLAWRQLTKLKSTYTDQLPNFADKQGRVHTSFALAATTTGRLSSSDPNLQNIPIRTEEGRRIRAAFVAPKGRVLVSADYSQIELRLLAHVADIPPLRQAFADGVDIHARTASEMFNVGVDEVSGDMRRRAKTINFGIIYGISSFGLATRLGISREEAGSYIKRYFERFPGIRDYMDGTKAFCREKGYVETLFGRACHYPGIKASNPSERAFNERAAINAPIQGTAADIIRRAMIRMEPALEAANVRADLLLQVHDELVFEMDEGEVEAALPVIRRVMVDAPHPSVDLAVPLAVEARAARNWEEAH